MFAFGRMDIAAGCHKLTKCGVIVPLVGYGKRADNRRPHAGVANLIRESIGTALGCVAGIVLDVRPNGRFEELFLRLVGPQRHAKRRSRDDNRSSGNDNIECECDRFCAGRSGVSAISVRFSAWKEAPRCPQSATLGLCNLWRSAHQADQTKRCREGDCRPNGSRHDLSVDERTGRKEHPIDRHQPKDPRCECLGWRIR